MLVFSYQKSGIKTLFLLFVNYMYVYKGYIHLSAEDCASVASDLPGAGVIRGCEIPNVCLGKWSLLIYKSYICMFIYTYIYIIYIKYSVQPFP